MTNMESIEKLVEKTGITYDEAREVLEANHYDLLDAVLVLEKEGKITGKKTVAEKETTGFEHFKTAVKRLFKASTESSFVIERKDSEILNVPVLVLLIASFIQFPLFVFLLILGLFLGCRYHFGGTGRIAGNANEMSMQAADFVDSFRTAVR